MLAVDGKEAMARVSAVPLDLTVYPDSQWWSSHVGAKS